MSEMQKEVEDQTERVEGAGAAQQSKLIWVQALREHPWITAFNVMCLCIGLILALKHLPAEWSLARRLTAGALSGIGIGLMITANRMLGAWR